MADNPTKKKADAKRISQQPHEQAYQRKKANSKTEKALDTKKTVSRKQK